MAILPANQSLSNNQKLINYFLAPTTDRIAYYFLKKIFFPANARNLSTLVGLVTLIFICQKKYVRSSSVFIYSALKTWQLIYRRWFLDPEDKKFENLLFADTVHHAGIVGEEISKLWREEHMSFQEIEQLLRRKNCDTFLIALPRDETFIPGMQSVDYNGVEKPYHLYLSCEHRSQAWKDQIQHQKKYQDNFAKLNDTGVKQFAPGTTLADLRQMGGTLHLTEYGEEQFAAELPAPLFQTPEGIQGMVS